MSIIIPVAVVSGLGLVLDWAFHMHQKSLK